MRHDLVYVLRGLARTPAFTLVSVLTLGIAIGATTAIATFVRGILLAPLPYPDADRLVTVTRYNRALGFQGLQVWGGELLEVREESPSFSGISGLHYEDLNLSGGSGPEKVLAGIVLPDLLSLLGVEASSGRVFLSNETEGVAILTHRLWVSRFGGSMEAFGTELRHDRGASTIVGVLPPGVEIPLRRADLLLPMDPALLRDPDAASFRVFARLRPGASLETAQAEVDAVARRLEIEHNWPVKGWYLEAESLRTGIVGEVAPTIWMLQAAAVLVLLIACANVAGLLLARGVLREREIAVRRALGAKRSIIARLLLVEGVLVTFFGGILGLVLGRVGTALFLSIAPGDLPRSSDVKVDGTILGGALLITLLVGILAGLGPALVLSRGDPRWRAWRGVSRLRGVFTVAQLAATMTLTVACGLLTQSLARLLSVDVGFEPAGLLCLEVSFPRDRYPEASHRSAAIVALIERLEAAAAVQAVGVAPWTPLTGSWSSAQMSTEDVSGGVRERSRWPVVLSVSPGFFPAAGIALVSGRGFEDRETREVAIVNRRLAERAWPEGDAVGRRIKYGGPNSDNPWLEVVGVVESSRLVGLATKEEEAMFHPLLPLQYPYSTLSLLVRTRTDPMDALPVIRAAVSEVDHEMPLSNIRAMEEIVGRNVQGPGFRLWVVSVFTGLAVGLAGLGIYGVVAGWAASRRREIGVRMALGASRSSILRLSLQQGAVLLAFGTFLGVLGSLAAARFLEAFLFEVSSFDPLTLVAALLLLSAVTLAAAMVPARRAAAIDPAEVLRTE